MNEKRVRQALYDYHWQIREIARMNTFLNNTEFKGVAASGVESVMPKAPYSVSDPIAGEVMRRDAQRERIAMLEKNVNYIQSKLHLIRKETLITVVNCMLDGMPAIDISRHLGVSRQSVYRYIDEIAKKLAS